MQVTSRGCSRAYIVCVLWHAWEYCKKLKAESKSICFPFPEETVEEWLLVAKDDCQQSSEFMQFFGGTEYSVEDSSTFWTLPTHFFTWLVFSL
jgi:hypothetical protein